MCRVRAGVQRLASVSVSRGRDMLRRRKRTSVARRYITQGAAFPRPGLYNAPPPISLQELQ
jgi:hypothetical protein